MIIRICYFTEKGKEICEKLLNKRSDLVAVIRSKDENLTEWTKEGFEKHLPILFIGACGIAVRTIAPYVKDKLEDSPVLVMDELGEYVIPILSGHMGGANEWARLISKAMDATPVITTATDVEKKFSVDVFAKENGLRIMNREEIRKVSSKILKGEKVSVSIEKGIEITTDSLPQELNLVTDGGAFTDIRIVTAKTEKKEKTASQTEPSISTRSCPQEGIPSTQSILLTTKPYILGMGCRKGKTFEELKVFLEKHCPYDLKDCLGLATIDLKQKEIGLLELATYYHLPFFTFSAEELKEVKGDFTPSEFVAEVTGVSNVCERSAMKAAGEAGELVLRKIAEDGMTLAIATKKPRIHTWNS